MQSPTFTSFHLASPVRPLRLAVSSLHTQSTRRCDPHRTSFHRSGSTPPSTPLAQAYMTKPSLYLPPESSALLKDFNNLFLNEIASVSSMWSVVGRRDQAASSRPPLADRDRSIAPLPAIQVARIPITCHLHHHFLPPTAITSYTLQPPPPTYNRH